MNLKQIWYILTLVIIAGFIFYLGYLFGHRNFVNEQTGEVEITANNGSKYNSLTDIEIVKIYGSKDSKNIATFGQFYYKIVDGEKTEVFIKMQGVPTKITQSSTRVSKILPTTLSIEIAKRTKDGLDYEYEKIGEITFDEPVDGKMTAEFSTIVDYPLVSLNSRIERVVFKSLDEEGENIYSLSSDTTLPLNVRDDPAPYFWIKLK